MDTGRKIIAWLCMVSTLLTGCTSTTLVEPERDGVSVIHSGRIASVIMKDGTEYTFTDPPEVIDDVIVGTLDIRVTEGIMKFPVALPLSEVAQVTVREENAVVTVLTLGSIIVVTVLVIAAVTFKVLE